MEITQHELDEASRKLQLISKEEAIETIKNHFELAHKQLLIRSAYDQTILGNLLTCLELEIKKDFKQLKTVKSNG